MRVSLFNTCSSGTSKPSAFSCSIAFSAIARVTELSLPKELATTSRFPARISDLITAIASATFSGNERSMMGDATGAASWKRVEAINCMVRALKVKNPSRVCTNENMQVR
ncbi:hypothetical protein D3C86_1396930 [compost metagenome]